MVDTAARLAILARRNEVLRFTIVVTGIDLTGVAMNMQVRLARGSPGAPRIQLSTVNTVAAEGLKLDSVTVVNGITTSIIKGRINQSTMSDASKVPYDGELGTDTILAYAMQWTLNGDANTRIEGEFIVRDTAYGSDAAPADRPPSYGATQPASGGVSSGSLTFGDQVIQVSIAGIEQLTPIVATATAAATQSVAASIVSVAASNVATGRAVAASVSAATADAAKQAVLDNIAGVDVQAGLTLQAVSRLALAAVTVRPEGRQAFLSEAGREGVFVWLSGNQSALVTADPDQGLYIAPASQADGSDGVWRRILILPGLPGAGRCLLSWFGVSSTYGVNADVPFTRLLALIPDGSTIVLPNYTITISASIYANGKENLTIEGSGPASFMQINPAMRVANGGSFWASSSMLWVGKGATVRNFRMQADKHREASGGGFCLVVSSGSYPTPTPNAVRTRVTDVQVYGMTFHGCSEAVWCFADYNPSFPAGDERRFWGPKGVKIHHNFFHDIDYQGVSLFSADDVDVTDNHFEFAKIYDEAGNPISPRFQPCIRILGTHGFRIANNTIYGPGDEAVGNNIQFAVGLGASNITQYGLGRRQNRDGIITGNKCYGVKVGVYIQEVRHCLIMGNVFQNEVTSSVNWSYGMLWEDGAGNGSVTAFGNIAVEDLLVADNKFVGFAMPSSLIAVRFRDMRFERNKFVSNSSGLRDRPMISSQRYSDEIQQDMRIVDNDFLYPATNQPFNFNLSSTVPAAQFTASISGTLMTVSRMANGSPPIVAGQLVTGSGMAASTKIVGPGPYDANPALSGGAGGVGTYVVSVAQAINSRDLIGNKVSHVIVRGNSLPENDPTNGYIETRGVGTVSKGIGLPVEEAGASTSAGSNERNRPGTWQMLVAAT